MDLPPSVAPRRRAPPQGRLCGRSPASSERRRGASLVAVPAGAPVSVARPRPRPKGTTAPGKPAPCVSRASPDPGRRPSTRRTVRPRRGPGAGGTRRQPSPARPAVAGYGISPRSRCGLPEPRHCIGKRGRPVHNPEPDMAGLAPQRSVVHLGATTWVQTSAGTCHTEPSPPPLCSVLLLSRDFRFACPGWPLYTPESRRLYHDFASGVRDDRPGLDSCLRSTADRATCSSGGIPSRRLTVVGSVTCARYAANSSTAAANTLLPSATAPARTFTPHRAHDTRHGVYCSLTASGPTADAATPARVRPVIPQRATERVPPHPDETSSRQRPLDPKR